MEFNILGLCFVFDVIWCSFMQRSQRKTSWKRMESLNKTSKGYEVITTGGLYGTVDEVGYRKTERSYLDVHFEFTWLLNSGATQISLAIERSCYIRRYSHRRWKCDWRMWLILYPFFYEDEDYRWKSCFFVCLGNICQESYGEFRI